MIPFFGENRRNSMYSTVLYSCTYNTMVKYVKYGDLSFVAINSARFCQMFNPRNGNTHERAARHVNIAEATSSEQKVQEDLCFNNHRVAVMLSQTKDVKSCTK